MIAATQPAAPEPGSHRYFALLYTPPARREALSTLLALADEIGTDPSVSADHSIAHVRLEWWRREAQRFAAGEPEHPWLRALLASQPQALSLNLQPLVEGAALDLATRTLSAREGEALPRAIFELAAAVLCAPPLPTTLSAAIGEMGVSVQRLERNRDDEQVRDQLPQQLQSLGDAPQAQLAPLLVWLALAAQPPRQGALLGTVCDNLIAWRAARRAVRGRFRL